METYALVSLPALLMQADNDEGKPRFFPPQTGEQTEEVANYGVVDVTKRNRRR